MKPCVECMEANGKYPCSQEGCCPLEGVTMLIQIENGSKNDKYLIALAEEPKMLTSSAHS